MLAYDEESTHFIKTKLVDATSSNSVIDIDSYATIFLFLLHLKQIKSR